VRLELLPTVLFDPLWLHFDEEDDSLPYYGLKRFADFTRTNALADGDNFFPGEC
jgi:hypothetical protein